MQKIEATSPEAQSTDIVTANIEQLRALFPELITEDEGGVSINVDVLKALVGDKTVSDTDEKYGLNWHGKRNARQMALTPSTGTLRPCLEDSVDWDTTENLMIEGDNLEVLKLLQKSYANKVKLIYIDPPYNTGKDFVYPDNFQDNIKNYLELTGQIEGGKKISSNTEASGRFHTDWLNMMYPRLKLARNLLRDDGVILIHMDEHEQANTSTLMAEIFGEENILGAAVWDKKNPKGDATRLAYQHESIFFVAKNQAEFAVKSGITRRKKNAEAILAKAQQLMERIGKQDAPADLRTCAVRYALSESCIKPHLRGIDLQLVNEEFADWIKNQGFSGGEAAYSKIDDAGDVYQSVSMAWPNKKKAPDDYFVPLKHPVDGQDCPIPARGWRNPSETMKKLLEAGEILFGSDHTTQPRRKYLLRQNIYENFPSVIGYGGSDDLLLSELGIPFDNPKPVDLARELISSILLDDGIVMDFFAGSGTTGHAIMAQNAADGCSRRYILVQLPEPLDSQDKEQKVAAEFCEGLGMPRNIAELTKERLRRAAIKIKSERMENALQLPLTSNSSQDEKGIDLGFRVFKLDSSNIRAWSPNSDDLGQTLLDHEEHLLQARTEEDILYELLLKLGLDLCVVIEHRVIGLDGAGKDASAIGGGVLIACLANEITREDVEPMAQGIVTWQKELSPTGDTTCIFRDSAFVDDVAKTNLAAILEQAGIRNVRSL